MQFYFKPEWRMPAVGVGSFAVGVGVGYFVATKRVKTITTIEEYVEYDVAETEAIADRSQLALDFARAATEQPRKLSIEDVGLAVEGACLVRIVKSEKFLGPIRYENVDPTIIPDPEPVEDEWNQDEEEQDRGPDSPYVLHREEYHAGTSGYSQTDLRYFAADNVLCDENEVPIYNPEKVVGRLEFGRGSGDADVTYIRNEQLKSEFMVTRDAGSYQIEVLGLAIEEEAEEGDLKHSNTVRRFRMGGPDAG
jgi:hypothetical protein